MNFVVVVVVEQLLTTLENKWSNFFLFVIFICGDKNQRTQQLLAPSFCFGANFQKKFFASKALKKLIFIP